MHAHTGIACKGEKDELMNNAFMPKGEASDSRCSDSLVREEFGRECVSE